MKGLKHIEASTEVFKSMSVTELRRYTLDYYNKNLKNNKALIKKHLKEVVLTSKAGRKIAYGEAMYSAKAAAVEQLKTLIEKSTYNNFGKRKKSDNPEILGYLNFKSKIIIDKERRHIRISLTLYKNRKTQLKDIEVGKKEKSELHKAERSSRNPQDDMCKSLSKGKDKKKYVKTNSKKLGVAYIDVSTQKENTTNVLEPLEPKPNTTPQTPATYAPPTPPKLPKSNYIQTLKDAKSHAGNGVNFNFNGPFAEFLGTIEKKPVHSVVITLDAPPGSGKTRGMFQFLNMAASSGYNCVFVSLEEHPQSALFNNKAEAYIDPENEPYISVVGDLPPTYEEFVKLVMSYDVIGIDSWNKVFEVYKVDFDTDLRKKLDGKIIATIFQRTQDNKMRGGSKAAFDGDIILEVVKHDDYRKSYIQARKAGNICD